jgi:hypothetical protein
VKYTSIRKLPARPRLAICGLYLIALGLITAAGWIAADATSIYPLIVCWCVQIWLLTHLIKRT